MTALLVIVAGILGALAGMWHEYHTGRLDHFMRWLSPPRFPTPQIFTHDDFLDDCEQFNRAMIAVPVDMRVLETPETIQ